MAAPKLLSAVPQSSTVIRATFDQGMSDNAALSNPASYTLTSIDPGIASLSVSAVTPEAVANPTYVDLTVNEMTDGGEYQLLVQGVSNAGAEVIDPSFDTDNFDGEGTKPTVASASAPEARRVRIVFSEPMSKDAALESISNYSITPVTPGAAPVYFVEIELPDTANPTFVDIPVSEMTDGADYLVTVSPTGPTDVAKNQVDSGTNTAQFTGVGGAPKIKQVLAVSKNRVDVVFDEPMLDSADLRDPSKYTFDNDLLVLSVLAVDVDTVKLATSDQVPGELYTLTVNP